MDHDGTAGCAVERPSKMMGLMVTGDEATIAFHVVADPA